MRAYRNAVLTIRALPRRLADMVEAGEDLSQLQGVGDAIAKKIAELVETGRLGALERLERDEGGELADLLRVPGLGPKRVHELHEKLGVSSPQALAEAARQGRIAALPGFGTKTEQAILRALARRRPDQGRVPRLVAEPVAEALVVFLRSISGVKRVAVVGSFRRLGETVGNLDILVTCKRGTPVLERLVGHEDVERVLSQGATRSSLRLRSGLQVDLRLVSEASYGAALRYFTGSKAHNIAIRTLGSRRGLEINEHGVFSGSRRVAGRSEREVYEQVGLPCIEPELREGRGEIETAQQGKLPRLVRLDDIRGDLHVHTDASDGRASLEEMAEAARSRGYEYLAIAEHTESLPVAGGLDAQGMRHHLRAIERLDQKLDDIALLKAAEVEILADGSLDLPEDLLNELDLCVGAVHSHFDLSLEKQTERILRAMDHRRFHVLAHPTGRLIGSRAPYAVDLERVIEGAAERGCWLELNAQPQRLDLTDVHARAAKERGVPVAISTDAHAPEHLDHMRLGVAQARRGWLEKADVPNTRSLSALLELLRGR